MGNAQGARRGQAPTCLSKASAQPAEDAFTVDPTQRSEEVTVAGSGRTGSIEARSEQDNAVASTILAASTVLTPPLDQLAALPPVETISIAMANNLYKRCRKSSAGGYCIELSNQQLTAVPTWMALTADTSRVTEIQLGGNRLREFPLELARYRAVERLALGGNQISRIPDEIGELKQLTWLDFTHNHVSAISDRLGDLPRLTSLGASDCRLTSFPLAITKLKKLKKLGVFNNLIAQVPTEIGRLIQLTKLDLSGNQLVVLPSEIGALRQLTWLNLSNNRLVSVPDEINQLTELCELGLSSNRLAVLPDMGNLRQLSLLTLFNNELVELGRWIGRLAHLSRFDISTNRLKALPAEIFQLPRLTLLNVRQNQLTSLPWADEHQNLAPHPTLTSLDVRDNQLAALPIALLGGRLEELKCSGNPFQRNQLPAGPSEAPRLSDLALQIFAASTVLSTRVIRSMARSLSPSTRAQVEAVANSSVGWQCGQCHNRFVHTPWKFRHLRPSTDEVAVPLEELLCSAVCRRAQIDAGHLSAMADHSSVPMAVELRE